MLTSLPQWQALQNHHTEVTSLHLRDLFKNDANRFKNFSFSAANIFLDYSKNHVTQKTMDLLFDLARAQNLHTAIENMFSGEKINNTENRAALHIALRDLNSSFKYPNAIHQAVMNSLNKVEHFVSAIQSGKYCGYNGKKITDIINIGIGGSDLGPALATHALTHSHTSSLRFHFISNIDSFYITKILAQLNPETSLFIVSSKSFITQETLINAKTIQRWFAEKTNNADPTHHFIAVTAQTEKAIQFGIAAENIFPIWDWVGGRYSLWSAVGLPIALAVGIKNFRDLLAGAHEMDQHFFTAPWQQNMPVILGLLGIWYRNFFNTAAHAILPYSSLLERLPTYLQQAEMESNGKSVTRDGEKINYATAPIIFGEPGTNGQHAFYQCLHQGTNIIPADFIAVTQDSARLAEHHSILFAHALSQSKALMEGKTAEEIHKVLPGNRPSNTLLLSEISPRSLGALLALYEHKIFVQSVIWNINAFDQWGVEYSKQLANAITPHLLDAKLKPEFDNSTNGLIERWWFY